MALQAVGNGSNLRLPEAAMAVLAVVFAAVFAMRRRRFKNLPTPDEIERRRREAIHQSGKLGDGEIIDIEGSAIIYSYSVAGVGYTASQDLKALESLLPSDVMSIIGPVSVKFSRGNPADSIVVCEQWSGLRYREKQLRPAWQGAAERAAVSRASSGSGS
jgi:hypothetical protein